jgi:hypothetical protein
VRPSCSSLETEPTLAQGPRSRVGTAVRGGRFEQSISGRPDVMAGGGSASDAREHEPDRPRKRGPKRGPNPRSKTVPTGHTASHGTRGTRSDESPSPARDFSVWRAIEMVDRGRIELPTPGFSAPSFRLSWRVVPDSGPQTGTQRIVLLEPASHSRPGVSLVPEIGGHGRSSGWGTHSESFRGVSALKAKRGFESPRSHHPPSSRCS